MSKEVVKAASVTPRVYVGTYGKYNNGDLTGKWLDLEDYADKEDFLEACKELHKDEADPEFMFQDYEGFPEKYYGESGLSEKLWDWLEMDEEDREILEVYQDEVIGSGGEVTLKQAQEAFRGKFKSETDWAVEYIDGMGGLGDSASSYLEISDTDARQYALDEAERVSDLDDKEVVEVAEMEDEYEVATGKDDRLSEIQEEIDALEEEEEPDQAQIDALTKEMEALEAADDVDTVVDKAREAAMEKITDETEEAIKRDPVGYFVDEQGLYTLEELSKANFMTIDYDKFVKDALDFTFVHHDGEVWVFENI
jgi:antirestriction protein